MRIGKVLLDAPGRTMTAQEISKAGGGTNVGRKGAQMAAVGLLEPRDPPPPEAKGPGRRAEKAFHLPEGQVDAVTAAIAAQAAPTGSLAAGQQLVFADVGNLSALMEALDVSELLAKASWFALCDGQPQEYVVAFVDPDAVPNAQALVAELQGARLAARRASVTQVDDAGALVAEAKTAATASRRARMRGPA